MKIACIGEAMIELSMAGENPHLGVAGDTLNTAIYLKRQAPDLAVSYITRLGTDPFSQRIETFIASHNIGTSQIEHDGQKSPGLYAITTADDGERSFTYWRSQAAARDMFQGADGLDFSALNGFDAIYLSGITLAIIPDTVRAGLLEFARSSGTTLAFDSNYRAKLWENQKTAQSWTERYWQAADILLPSVDDEMELFDEDAATVKERFTGYRGTGALKQSDIGPSPINGTATVGDYAKAPKVVDTTAAGDSFSGAFLGSYFQNSDLGQAMQAGHNMARYVVQHRGAIAPAT